MLSSKIAINKEEFNLLRTFIQKECGILVNEDKAYLIESRLARLVVKTGCKSFKEFYLKVKSDTTKKLKTKVIDAMTTNETLWFRDKKPWTLFKEKIIPQFKKELTSGKKRKIVIWSAASSTGQEPYTMAMLLHEAFKFTNPDLLKRIKILATDISPSALYMGISGRYNNIAMSRGLPDKYRRKYFKQEQHISTINDDIKKMVTFKKFNLQKPFTKLPKFDMILCRNVAIYFSKNFKIQLFNKIHRQLHDDGIFMLGSTETLMGYSTKFEQLEYKNAVYYKPKK